MKTVGDILKQGRRERGWTVAALSARTKIQERFISALEDSAMERLPDAAFVKGFIRTLAVEMDMDPESMVARWRRDFERAEPHVTFTANDRSRRMWQWTPQRTIAAFIIIAVLAFGAYLGYQLIVLSQPPLLTVEVPIEHTVVFSPVPVEGRTDPSATLSVNGQNVRKNRNGTFSVVVDLAEGERVIRVESVGQNRKTTTVERTVTVTGEDE